MAQHFPPLNEAQKNYIREKHTKMTVRKMARYLETSVIKVTEFMKAEGLPFLKTWTRRNIERISQPASEYFEWRNYPNGLI